MTHFLQRTALIALATGALGACSTTDSDALRPSYPVRASETTPPPPAAAPAPAPAPTPAPSEAPATAAPAAPVEERPLAPLARPPAATPAPAPVAAPPPRPAPPPAPAFRTVTTRSVTGKVIEVEGPAATYEVKKGDNLEKIARKLDTTVDQLRDDNDLGKRKAIQPGQTLKGPRTTAHAYVTSQGDTLYSIAKRFGVSADALRDENDLPRNASLRTGLKIRLPEGYSDRGPLTTTTRVPVAAPPPVASPPPTYSAPAPQPAPPRSSLGPAPYTPAPTTPTPRPYTPPPRAYVPPPQSASPSPYATPPRAYTPPPRAYVPPAGAPAGGPMTSAAPSDAQISELGRGRFVWPLQGSIISDFGPKAPGQRNDGINIGAQLGASIRAAAAGDVVYAGDQVPGFGNLVLIKHADGWVTAYGHLSRVIVKMQQKVVQGQEIGQAGATGGVAEPQLHFEVRYASTPLERAKPVDPKLVLPK